MIVKNKRRSQLAQAQSNFKRKQKTAGLVRIEIYCEQEVFQKLQEQTELLNLSRSAYISQLIMSLLPQPAVTNSTLLKKEPLAISLASRDELIQIIQRQKYWLDRLQAVEQAASYVDNGNC